MENTNCPYLSEKFLGIFHEYTQAKLKKERTRKQYWYVICSLCNFTQCDFLNLDSWQIRDYFSKVIHSGSDTLQSTNYDLSVLRALCRYLDENEAVYHLNRNFLNLFDNIEVIFPDMAYRMEDLPSLSDIDIILQYYKNQGDMVGFLACAMALRTALTTSELASLKQDMFLQDLNGNYGLRLPVSDFAYRYIKLPKDIAELITLYTTQRTDKNPSLFLNKKGQIISPRALQNRLHTACLACNIKPFTYHDLRIVSQTIMIKDGAPLDQIAQYADIKTLNWFCRYNRIVNELSDSAVDYTHIKVVW